MVVEVHLSFRALMLSQLGFGSGEALARFPQVPRVKFLSARYKFVEARNTSNAGP